ncbi:DUF1836 domain-containing protein [Apilactobacillus timberlakei]|uniref:DUF1836 domain-containing protein n=1 Tax=Apilactobacillus timberlakei TaxID=2008380 RepID=A0ABY2YZD7_9LACO|nr:DUF1836 domain-containing protein [Apilactobacillus timberlakei]TPR14872.1 DUF1836 domain-containing protein [Apilactobacillus timberlakei]TPR15842.1 DUF1836 domain-containing protein [Apilactobacillus timberlakei]TPR16203.1 DUF1836 domain-containing protein [Apilactobacillus timberlakei]TPR18127.1 DUF1836 domain-containing protein [Apilactobacillus timberlakei]TPR18943.1 DUF1836 domain-containing protein [Apilactobacillus timberlakei]
MNKQYNKWQTQMKSVSLPKWEDLPKFDLYMDQLIAVVNEAIGPLGMDTVTRSMVNNYVKQKATFAPVKKKYQTVHVADIIVISLLKPVFSIKDIRQGIDEITKNQFPKQAYDEFIETLVEKLHHIADEGEKPVSDNDIDHLLNAIADTIINRLIANEIYSDMMHEE